MGEPSGVQAGEHGAYGRRNVAALIADASLFRAIVGSGLEPFVLAHTPRHVLRRSRFFAGGALVADPAIHPERFIEDLAVVGDRFEHRPPLCFTHDGVLLLVSKHRDYLSTRYRLLMPPHETVEALVHKTAFATYARRHALPVPVSLRSDEIADARDALAVVGLPCVLKPVSRHRGWHDAPQLRALGVPLGKVLRADTRAQFEHYYDLMRQVTEGFILQAYVHGGDDCIHSYHAYLDERSRPLASFVGRKVRTWPRDSGVSTCLELVHDDEVLGFGERIALRLGLVGPVKFDFKRDVRTGGLYLLEVNARCSLWHHLGVVAGVNLPLTAWRHLNGLPDEGPSAYRTGFRWMSPGADLRAFLRSYRPAGELTWRQYLASLRGHRTYDLLEWNDPSPALARAWHRQRARLRNAVRAHGPVRWRVEKAP